MQGIHGRTALAFLSLALAGPAAAKPAWRMVYQEQIGTEEEATTGAGVLTAAFLNKTFGIAVVGNGGAVRFTTDAGMRWISGEVPTNISAMNYIEVVSRDMAWGAGPTFLRMSTDGGKTWRAQPDVAPCAMPGRYLSFSSGKMGWMGWIGCLNATMSTEDGGRTWNAIPLPKEVDEDITAIDRLPEAGYLLLNKGLLFKTVDNGKSWEKFVLPLNGRKPLDMLPQAPIEAVRFRDVNHGTVVLFSRQPERGFTVLQTEDGGKTWREDAMPGELKNAVGSVFLSRDTRYLTITHINSSTIYVFEHH